MPQEETIYIPKGASSKDIGNKLSEGISRAQIKASHARNVEKSRQAAAREYDYAGGGAGMPENDREENVKGYRRDTFSLPTRDAEDTARRVARAAGGYRKTAKRSGRR